MVKGTVQFRKLKATQKRCNSLGKKSSTAILQSRREIDKIPLCGTKKTLKARRKCASTKEKNANKFRLKSSKILDEQERCFKEVDRLTE